ncbi:hypothetical protein CYMTET_45533 [Cymbomonas tetramitiformis]|uniref:Uncharacterized protein n=1 Tax=Cymbomonas tetramitiformis TaxID=36881 RepID=A0AAE0BY20_9CHLO|nr:hypothetical protein CYMTET_45533 [Cymbomonas tetramitiformis]
MLVQKYHISKDYIRANHLRAISVLGSMQIADPDRVLECILLAKDGDEMFQIGAENMIDLMSSNPLVGSAAPTGASLKPV